MAAETALSITEIRALVLSFAPFSTLAVCARLNSLWNHDTPALLWRGQEKWTFDDYDEDEPDRSLPDVVCLERMAAEAPAKLRENLSHTYYLNLHSPAEGRLPSSLPHLFVSEIWRKCRPRYVQVDITSNLMLEADMALLLQPNLRAIDLFGGYYGDSFLRAIENNAPRLKSFLLDNRSPEDMTSHGLCAFLGAMPSLTQFELIQGWDNAVDKDSLLKLLSRPNLRRLSVDWQDKPGTLLAHDLVRRLNIPDEDCLLQRLSKLEVSSMELGALPKVLKCARSLRSVSFTSRSLANSELDNEAGSTSAVFDALSCIPTLEEAYIDVESMRDAAILKEGLTAISQACPQMHIFELHAETTRFVARDAAPTQLMPHNHNFLDTTTLQDLTRRWPLLRALTLSVPCTLILSTTFWSIATHCPHLHALDLSAQVDLFSAPVSPPSARFLALESLDIKVATPPDALHRPGGSAQLEDDLLDLFVSRLPALLYRGHASNRVLRTILEQMRKRAFAGMDHEQKTRLRRRRFIDVPLWVNQQTALMREALQD